jgi:hypothetical protein
VHTPLRPIRESASIRTAACGIEAVCAPAPERGALTHYRGTMPSLCPFRNRSTHDNGRLKRSPAGS